MEDILLYIVTFLLISSTILATITDPTDPSIYQQRSEFSQEIQSQLQQSNHPLKFKCSSCNLLIKKDTKHCRQCNRCCENLDHHCKWFNNCVGRKNYRYFIHACVWLLASVLLSISIKVLWSVWSKQINYYMMTLGVIQGVAGFYAAQLLYWHHYFYKKGITTFTYIQFQKDKEQKMKLVKSKKWTKEKFDLWYSDMEKDLNNDTYH